MVASKSENNEHKISKVKLEYRFEITVRPWYNVIKLFISFPFPRKYGGESLIDIPIKKSNHSRWSKILTWRDKCQDPSFEQPFVSFACKSTAEQSSVSTGTLNTPDTRHTCRRRMKNDPEEYKSCIDRYFPARAYVRCSLQFDDFSPRFFLDECSLISLLHYNRVYRGA